MSANFQYLIYALTIYSYSSKLQATRSKRVSHTNHSLPLIRSSALKALSLRRGQEDKIKVMNKKKKLENFHSKHNLMKR